MDILNKRHEEKKKGKWKTSNNKNKGNIAYVQWLKNGFLYKNIITNSVDVQHIYYKLLFGVMLTTTIDDFKFVLLFNVRYASKSH